MPVEARPESVPGEGERMSLDGESGGGGSLIR